MGISIAHMTTLAAAEEAGQKLAQGLGAASLADFAGQASRRTSEERPWTFCDYRGRLDVPEDLSLTYAHHKENDVDILVGSNRDERTFFSRPGGGNAEQFSGAAKKRFTGLADAYLKLYPASSDTEAGTSQLASFRDEMGWHMRTWAQLQSARGKGKAYL